MQWDVVFKDKTNFQVELPDRLPVGVSMKAKVNGKEFSFRLCEDQQLVILEENQVLERCLKVRDSEVRRQGDQSGFSTHFTLLDRPIPEPISAKVEKFAPGGDQRRKSQGANGITVLSEITGKVLDVKVKPGDLVDEGAILCVIEAMKMENKVFASMAGKVESVVIQTGDSVKTGQTLVKIKGT